MKISKKVLLLHFIIFVYHQPLEAQLYYQRTFTPDTIVNVGEPIQVTIQLINQSTDTLKGLVYSEQIPINIHFTPVSAQINNQPYTGVILEQGNSSAVCNNHYPQRWIFQTPPSFPLAGSILPGDEVQIRYELTAISDTTFPFNNDAWYGGLTAGDTLRPVFGFDSLNNIQLSFIGPNLLKDNLLKIRDLIIVSHNYPNPFNPITFFDLELKIKATINIDIFNALGMRVHRIHSRPLIPGKYSLKWNAENFPSGIYFYTIRSDQGLQSKQFTQQGKMLLLR